MRRGILTTVLILLLGAGWFFRTWLQPLVMLIWTTPAIIQALILWCVLHLMVFRSSQRKITFPYQTADKEKKEYNSRDSLPEASEQLRLMPFEVARRYARDSLQLSQFRLGTEHVALIDGNLSYMFP